MMAWSRLAMARSGSLIAAMLASASRSPSAFPAAAFTSRARSVIAARSSAVNTLVPLPLVLFPDFCVSFIRHFLPSDYERTASLFLIATGRAIRDVDTSWRDPLTPTALPAPRSATCAVQLCDLDHVARGVIRLGDGRACHLGGWHLEFGAGGLHPLIVALDVVREEHGCGLALLKERLLVGLGRGIVVARELQLGAISVFGRRHGQPPIPPLRNVRLFLEAGHLGVAPI